MDEMTKKALSEFLQQTVVAAKAGAQWTADQAPLLVQEWLRWQLVGSLIWVAALAVALVVTSRVFKHMRACYKRESESSDYARQVDAEGYTFGSVIAVMAGAAIAVQLVGSVTDAVKVVIAPRVVVLEKLSELLK